jgi:hypothetical protein
MCPSDIVSVEGIHSWSSTIWLLQTSNTDETCTANSKYNNTLHCKHQIPLGGNTAVVASLTNAMRTDLKLQHFNSRTHHWTVRCYFHCSYTHKLFHWDQSSSYTKLHPAIRSSSLDPSVYGRSQIRIPAQSFQEGVEPFRPYKYHLNIAMRARAHTHTHTHTHTFIYYIHTNTLHTHIHIPTFINYMHTHTPMISLSLSLSHTHTPNSLPLAQLLQRRLAVAVFMNFMTWQKYRMYIRGNSQSGSLQIWHTKVNQYLKYMTRIQTATITAWHMKRISKHSSI